MGVRGGQKSRFGTYRALQWSDNVHNRSTLEVSLVSGLGDFRGRNYATGGEINSELVKLTVNLDGSGGQNGSKWGSEGSNITFLDLWGPVVPDDLHTWSG